MQNKIAHLLRLKITKVNMIFKTEKSTCLAFENKLHKLLIYLQGKKIMAEKNPPHFKKSLSH